MRGRIGWNITCRALEGVTVIACSLAQFSLLTGYLSKQEVGRYALLLACMFFLNAFSYVFGIMGVMTREITQGRDRSAVISSGVLLELAISCVLAAVFLPLVASVEYFEPIRSGLIVVASAFLIGAAPLTLQAVLSANEEMGKLAAINSIAQIVSLALVYLCILKQASLFSIYLAYMSLNVVQVVLTVFLSKLSGTFSLSSFSLQEARYILKEASPIVIMIVIAHLYVRIDVFMIDIMLGKEEVALYTAAYNFLDYLMILSHTIVTAVFPNFTGLALRNQLQFKLLYRKIIRIYATCLFPLAVLVAFFSPELLTLVYGVSYTPASGVVALLMVAAIIAWLNGPSGTIFIAVKQQNIYVRGSLFSLIINFIGNLFLIPILGYEGAAISTVLTEIALCSFCLFHIYRLIDYVPLLCRLEPATPIK